MSGIKLPGDFNKDGLVNKLDTFAYVFNLVSPFILIGVGLFANVPEGTRQWVIAGGLGLAGNTGVKKIVDLGKSSSHPQSTDEPEWF